MSSPGDPSTSKNSHKQNSPNSPNQRRPAVLFESLPGIKIITPPKGQFSPKVDERCITFCSQTITGRIHRREPECYSICVRSIFAHEVRNIIAFKNHRDVDSTGKARYPLPVEGQHRQTQDETELMPPPPKENQYWEEGLYVWFSKSRWAAQDHMSQMSLTLARQMDLTRRRASRHAIWNEYQAYLKRQAATQASQTEQTQSPNQLGREEEEATPLPTVEEPRHPSDDKWFGPIVPPHPGPDLAYQANVSYLLHPTAPVPVLHTQVLNLLKPARTMLALAHESVVSGEQLKFWGKVWDKAWTKEPFTLAARTVKWSLDKWKESDSNADS